MAIQISIDGFRLIAERSRASMPASSARIWCGA
jgi:hypothetical protein